MCMVETVLGEPSTRPHFIWTNTVFDQREIVEDSDSIVNCLWPQTNGSMFRPWVGSMQHAGMSPLRDGLYVAFGNSIWWCAPTPLKVSFCFFDVQSSLNADDAKVPLLVWKYLILMVLLFARASKQDLDVIVLAALFESWQKLKILPLA